MMDQTLPSTSLDEGSPIVITPLPSLELPASYTIALQKLYPEGTIKEGQVKSIQAILLNQKDGG